MSQHLAEVVRANIAAASRSFETIVTDYGALQTKWATTQAALEAAWRETDEAKRARDIAVNIGKKRLVELDNARKELFDAREQLKAVEDDRDRQHAERFKAQRGLEIVQADLARAREELKTIEASRDALWTFVDRFAKWDGPDGPREYLGAVSRFREEARRLVMASGKSGEALWPLTWPVYAVEAAQAALDKFMSDFAGNDLARTERIQKFAAGYSAAMEDRRTA